jgi:hypothetical protein
MYDVRSVPFPTLSDQCCQMVYLRAKNTNLGKLWKVLQRKVVFFTANLSILRPDGIFNGLLVHFVDVWYTFSRFGMLYR